MSCTGYSNQCRFILTGSEQFLLDERISQSLAGRTAILRLLPFSLSELNGSEINPYWKTQVLLKKEPCHLDLNSVLFNGFYPRIHDKKLYPSRWYGEYYDTYVSRDLRQLLNVGDLKTFETFIKLLAGRSGQLLNMSSLGNDAGVSHTTVKRWVSILQTSYIIDVLHPYYKNFGKRAIKSPKIYFLDSGLLCSLLQIKIPDDISFHPLRGQIFETFVYSEIVKTFTHAGEKPPLYFWQDSQKNEVDVIIDRGTTLPGVEIKAGMTLNDDFFTNLRRWQIITNASERDTSLVYGGNDYATWKGNQVIPWHGVS